MGLLENKGWKAQDLYNEYLDLKVDVSGRIKNLEWIKSVGTVTDEGIRFKQEKLDEEVDRLKSVLNQLEVEHGVSMRDVLLLSIGVEV